MDRLVEQQTKVQSAQKVENKAENRAANVILPKRQAPANENSQIFAQQEEVLQPISKQSQPENAPQIEQKENSFKEEVLPEPPKSSYLNSFQNMTVADIRREEEAKSLAEFEKEKEELISKVYETPEEQPVNIIEKPNYDFIEENKKIVKLTRGNSPKSKKKSSKKAGIALAATLGICGILCVTNTVLLENMGTELSQIEEIYNFNLQKYLETYNFNLQKYLRDINNLDATKKSMEFLDTYPDEMQDAGSIGQSSNWFDRLCNFLAGLFGG